MVQAFNITSESRAAALLGGPKTLQLEGSCPLAWISAIRKGFPALALDSFELNINATNTELVQILGISRQALERRWHKSILSTSDSERLLRVASVIVRAEDAFDNFDKALIWMKEPNISLGGEAPISLLDTDIGTKLVVDVLGRIEHGVFA